MMRHACAVFLIGAVLVGLRTTLALAQQDEVWVDPEPEPEPYVSPPAWKSAEVGDFYLRKKKYRAALSRYQEAVKVDPYYAPGYLGLGKVYDKIGLSQKALDAYQKFLDLLPSTKQAEEAKDVHKAIARLERKLRKSKAASRKQASSPDNASSSLPP
ncbi:MAG: tetratricopeptide repeat protein [Acidobacteria bacterium]|nr:tetratricopeptide repeat protein [Acidobacteriota bacterium]MBI1982966.1 tetratricopeptide repeat protein [Acidobacteriota bacterium]